MAAETEFPYTTVPNSLQRLLEKIPTIGAPEKATQTWLAGIGFAGGNNKRSLGVLRTVGIITTSGEPTPLWMALRAKDRARFGAGIKSFYADLFSTYPDADKRDDETLVAFVRAKTNYAEQAQRLAVRTFKVLASFGDYDADPSDFEDDAQDGDEHDAGKGTNGRRTDRKRSDSSGGSKSNGVSLTVNLQLQLPPSQDGEVYEKLFAAMEKHLKGLISAD